MSGRIIKCEKAVEDTVHAKTDKEPRCTMKVVRANDGVKNGEPVELSVYVPAEQICAFQYPDINCARFPCLTQPDAASLGPMIVSIASLSPLEIVCDNYGCAFSRRCVVRL